MNTASPPQPLVDPSSQGFWDIAAQGRLALQACKSCGRYQFPALENCRACGGVLEWRPVSGRGTIHTFIIQHHNVAPGFEGKHPYPIALVCPEEAPELRVPAQIECKSLDAVKIGAKVSARIIDLPGGKFKIPIFVLEA